MAEIVIYSKEWCPYCSKAKALLRSKGLEYTEIDITRDLVLEDEMIERSGMRTVPQVFIDGQSVGGYDALANLNASGELDRLLHLGPIVDLTKVYDVLVIGAGPAGLTAAVYAARKNLSTLVVAIDVGGQVGTTAEIANYPGFDSVAGPDLIQRMLDQVDAYDIEMLIGERVCSIQADKHVKVVGTASKREIRAKAVIVASGAKKRGLGVPGEKELYGRGVVYCSTCDGPLFRGRRIAVVGGGNSALEAAIEMSGIASHVYLVSRVDWNGDPILQDKVALQTKVEVIKPWESVEIHGKDKVEAFTVRKVGSAETRRLDVDGVFIEVGLSPNTDFVIDLLETNARGEIKITAHGETGLRGVFAAGDATESHDKQIVIAAGEGARAALAAFEYLVKQV